MQITVFCYHNAILPGLERDLAFLADNGYRTLTASEVVDALTGAISIPDKAVALTFDDALLSLKTVGLPLLERYAARATTFAITGLAPEGRVEPQGAGDRYRLLGWDDLRALRDSGRFEIGSHGHRHNPVHVPAEGVGGGVEQVGGRSSWALGMRVGPPKRRLARARAASTTSAGTINAHDHARLYDVPVPYTPACDAGTIRAVDGTRAHASQPLFAAETILVDGAATPAAPSILADLRASRDQLADRLGVDRFHLCLPYGVGTEAMPEMARHVGFASLFWTQRRDRDANRRGDDPYRIVRRKHDFVRRLPGRGRRSALDVLVTKVTRRLRSDAWE